MVDSSLVSPQLWTSSIECDLVVWRPVNIRWIPTCAKLFLDKREVWQHLVPPNETDSTELVKEFFSCVAALMSAQLRSMVVNSLADFLSFFQMHSVSVLFIKVTHLSCLTWISTIQNRRVGLPYFYESFLVCCFRIVIVVHVARLYDAVI